MDPTMRFIREIQSRADGAYQPTYDDTKAQDHLRDRPAGTYLCRPLSNHPGVIVLNIVGKEKITQQLLKIESRCIVVLSEDGSQDNYSNVTELFRATLATIPYRVEHPTCRFLREINQLGAYQRFDEAKAQDHLRGRPSGTFLFRPSPKNTNLFILNAVNGETGNTQLLLKIEADEIKVLNEDKGEVTKRFRNLTELLAEVEATIPYVPLSEPPLTRQNYLQMIETNDGYQPDLNDTDTDYILNKQPSGTYLFCASSRPERWDIELKVSHGRMSVSTYRMKINDSGIWLVWEDGIISRVSLPYKELKEVFRALGGKNAYIPVSS